jgi:hypothetical protein
MELAVPLLALGGMYIISNQRNTSSNNELLEDDKENYTNMGKDVNYLPNVEKIPQNYPVENDDDIKMNLNKYSNPNVATDKYFNQNVYENKVSSGKNVSNNIQEVYSLTGDYVNSEEFKHNNMVPFNGGKVRGNTYNSSMGQSILDNMSGSGSQFIQKTEQAPLFKPEDNMSWTYGAPNQSDFYQSRVNPGTVINNVKPFESEVVGPGLNNGYTTQGSGGFNSGLESRDRWLPPTVDELRTATNPKLEYELVNHEGPANSSIKNIGLMGKMEKHLPDTYFENTPDRWFTTTGDEKKQTYRSTQEKGIVKRIDQAHNYTGIAGKNDGEKSYVNGKYEDTKRVPTATKPLNHANIVGKGPNGNVGNKNSYHFIPNNRATVDETPTFVGGISGALGAVIAPIVDVLRPTMKEENVNNIRIFGDARSNVPETYIINPNDKTATTIKETTLYAPSFNINNQKEGTYINTLKPLDPNQRSTTNCEYIGIADGESAPRNYHAEYMQHNNEIKSSTIKNRTNQGGTQIYNQYMNVTNLKQDTTRYDNRVNAPVNPQSTPISVNNYGKTNQGRYEQSFNTDQIDPSLVDAFRKNPYTHSLHSAA